MLSFGKTFDNYIKNLSKNETEKVLDLLDSSDKIFASFASAIPRAEFIISL